MSTEREQKLVDIMFQLVDTAGRPSSMQWFIRLDREQRMEWVAKVLKENGFPTQPVGMSWGVLK